MAKKSDADCTEKEFCKDHASIQLKLNTIIIMFIVLYAILLPSMQNAAGKVVDAVGGIAFASKDK